MPLNRRHPRQATGGHASLSTVLRAGRTGLAELARLLGVLQGDENPSAGGPQPTLSELDRLVRQSRRGGLPVTLHVEGSPGSMPASVDACAFGIVQEGLTNALKHAGQVLTHVTVRFEGDGVSLDIINAQAVNAPLPTANGNGHGLRGMRERVAMHNGTLRVGPQPSGGFRVSARLPVSVDR